MAQSASSTRLPATVPRPSARLLLAAAVALGFVAGYCATPRAEAVAAIANAGPELVRLLRAMALLKLAAAAAAAAFVTWRLRVPATPSVTAGYLASVAAMAAGPGLMWSVAHVVLGALFLYGGLATLLVVAWRGGPARPRTLPKREHPG